MDAVLEADYLGDPLEQVDAEALELQLATAAATTATTLVGLLVHDVRHFLRNGYKLRTSRLFIGGTDF